MSLKFIFRLVIGDSGEDGGGTVREKVWHEPQVPNLVMAVQLLINYLINIYCIPHLSILGPPSEHMLLWEPLILRSD